MEIRASVDVQTPAESAFVLLCDVEKWPLWLPFLRTAKLHEPGLGLGSEISVRSAIPGESEQLFEVDRFIKNHHVSLVGAFSTRRRLDFRIEGQSTRSRLHARLEYPAYGGRLGVLFDRVRTARKLTAQFDEAVLHFKHLVEYNTEKDALLADF
ncbi:MAG TPA: SRPBCC family protein [Candidatus Rubrimentiphilum sp.]|nr:SRPBCC family protein [Candidatus Rubrimentiphilum sp.]